MAAEYAAIGAPVGRSACAGLEHVKNLLFD
eukprot:SAG11_NODE_27483_length_332_cov_0.785408_1_plen_29_part_01